MKIYFAILLATTFPALAAGQSAAGAGAASDAKAVELAKAVMEAMGGRHAWDNTRYISWNFFGRRQLLWDKKKGLVRVEASGDKTVYLVDIGKGTGKVMRNGALVEQPDSLAKYVKQGKSIWINDSYWLTMPYKLLDPGVRLAYLGFKPTQEGREAEVLQLTFDAVGDTPQNKYHVYIDPKTHLVAQWEYFRVSSDEKPTITTPWLDYQRHGAILLSGNRGGQRQLTNIAVYRRVPQSAFNSFDPVDFANLEK